MLRISCGSSSIQASAPTAAAFSRTTAGTSSIGRLAGGGAPPRGALRAGRGVREPRQRFVRVAKLVRDHRQPLAPVGPRVHPPELGAAAVEPLEHRLELLVA